MEDLFPSVRKENSKRLFEGILKKYDSFGLSREICNSMVAEQCIPMTYEMFCNTLKLARNYKDYTVKLKAEYGFDLFTYPSAITATLIIDTLEQIMFDEANGYIRYYIHDLDFGTKWEPDMILDEDGTDIELTNINNLWAVLVDEIAKKIKES